MAEMKNENIENLATDAQDSQEEAPASGSGEQEGGQENKKDVDPVLAEKTKKYVEKLLAEKLLLDNSKHPNAIKLLKQEIEEIQATGARANKSTMYLNVFKYKPVKVVVKVLVPVKQYPGFNFVGKILGPKGQNFKNLQEDTMCRMAIFGKGSMKDKKKEEEFRNSLDPKYSHLTEDLHVEISAMAPPAEAYARVAYALTEIQKYLIPDDNELMMLHDNPEYRNAMNASGGGPPPRKQFRAAPAGPLKGRGGGPQPRGGLRPGPNRIPQPPRLMPTKAKVMSILDRARNAMDDFGGPSGPGGPGGPGAPGGYDDFDGPNGGYGGDYGYDDFGGDYYGGGGNSYSEPQPPRWKSNSSVMTRPFEGSRFRSAPYSRSGR